MERVTFLIERTGDQLACLLNPESLVLRRQAGVRHREATSGQLTEAGLSDRPLLFTGGGTTEVELELLFDVSLAGSTISARNVRDLTGPLWALAENSDEARYGRPPLLRFIWGKTFNLPGIVVGVAERLERFTADGIPTRSWMRMRIVRVDAKALRRERRPAAASMMEAVERPPGEGTPFQGAEVPQRHQGERLDQLALRSYGSPAYWRLLARHNNIDDPLRLSEGMQLSVPPITTHPGS